MNLKEKLEKIEKEKPHFYIVDLNNYHREYLIEIVLWQEEKIKALEKMCGEIDKGEQLEEAVMKRHQRNLVTGRVETQCVKQETKDKSSYRHHSIPQKKK